MDVYQVGEGLKFHRGITHVVLDMQVTDSLEECLIRNTDCLRPNPFKVLNEALPRPTIPNKGHAQPYCLCTTFEACRSVYAHMKYEGPHDGDMCEIQITSSR